MKIISIVSAKGGVGKTTISANLCSALRKSGHEVLVVDVDPQNSLRLHFGIDPMQDGGIALSDQRQGQWAQSMVKGNHSCSVLPYGKTSEDERTAFEYQLTIQPHLLKEQLLALGLPENTVVVIDTPPGPSIYLKQALSAANIVVIASLADAASYATIPMIEGLIKQYCQSRADFMPPFYVINQLDRSRQLAGDIADIMAMQYGTKNIAIIHQDQSIPEALAYNQDAIEYAPESRGASDFIDFSLAISRILNGRTQASLNGQSL